MSGTDMGAFWDERAREDAFFFVDNNVEYRATDEARFWAGGVEAIERIFALLEVSLAPDDTVVEIGCGLGRLTRELSRRASSVLALDVSAEMLARARELNPKLENVRWVEGDGVSLTGVSDGVANACVSHVVFQHIPDPAVTLGYVREMGRVLAPGGFAAFHISNDAQVHRPQQRGVRQRARESLGRAPRGQAHPAWLGSAVELGDLEAAADEASMDLERVVGEGTQFCLVRLRRRPN